MTAYVTVEGRTLAAAMKIINAVVERGKRTIPILTMVRLHSNGQHLQMEATDLDNYVTTQIDAIDVGPQVFDVCVSAAILGRIARQAGAAPVTISPGKQRRPWPDQNGKTGIEEDCVTIDVAGGDATYSLQARPSTDFPSFPADEWQPLEGFTNGRLAAILDKVATCISTEETRYYLNGVCWGYLGGHATFTATDGHRLASYKYAEGDYYKTATSTIIPLSAVRLLRKLTAGKDVAVQARWSEYKPAREERIHNGEARMIEAELPRIYHLRFVAGRTTIDAKTIDGTFPDWRRVVPVETPYRLECNGDQLLAAVERVTMMSNERGRAVRLHAGEDGTAYVSVNNPDSGTAKARVFAKWPVTPDDPTEKVDGGGFKYWGGSGYSSFGFNAHYLKQAISKRPPEQFTFRFLNAGSPVLIEDGDADLTRVLMPMRV